MVIAHKHHFRRVYRLDKPHTYADAIRVRVSRDVDAYNHRCSSSSSISLGEVGWLVGWCG